MMKIKTIALTVAMMAWAGSAIAEEPMKHKSVDDKHEKDFTTFALSAGGLINGGNTQSWTLNAGYSLALGRGRHGFSTTGQFAYGRASLVVDKGDGTFTRRDWDDTTKNATIDARYDFFLTDMDAIFIGGKFRWDTFAGLDYRLRGQIGYLRELYKTDKQRLWIEAGYDLTYDNLDPDPLLDPNLSDAEKTANNCADPATAAAICYNDEAVVHAARLFTAYKNDLYENIQFFWSTEVLLNLKDFKDVRVNLDLALRASIAEKLQVEMKYRMLFDNVPVPNPPGLQDRAKADHQFIVGLIYTFL